MLRALEDVAYSGIRGLHLALIAGQIPAALWFYLGSSPHPGLLAVALGWLIGILALLFLLPLDQARYPVSIVPAIRRTGPMALNLAILLCTQGSLLIAAFFG